MTRTRKPGSDDKAASSTPVKSAVASGSEQTTTSTAPFPNFSSKKPGERFTPHDYGYLCENEHLRYMGNSKSGKVAHAVIRTGADGKKTAYQYVIPSEGTQAPSVLPLVYIQQITRFGMTRYQARASDGTIMYAKRYSKAKFGGLDTPEEEIDIGYFSPSEKEGGEPFWGSEAELPLFLETEDFKKELAEIGDPGIKGGQALEIERESVMHREANKDRGVSQNSVMGESAVDAYRAFYETWTDELTPEAKEVFKRAIEAPLRDMFKSNYRPEWLHAVGHSLTPLSRDPQRPENLGAAPKWTNTEMMVLERIAKWFALNIPQAYVAIKPTFEMLLDSELVERIKFEVTIKERGAFIQFLQDIDPFKKYHLFRKASDLGQAVAIADSILSGRAPISELAIQLAALNPEPMSVPTGVRPLLAPVSTTVTVPVHSPVASAAPMAIHPLPIVAPVVAPVSFPTQIRQQRSLVQISTRAFEADYDEPWLGSRTLSSSGTGFVIEEGGKKYVLTNAHCVENALVMRVRFANSTEQFEATRLCVSYQCDLAILEVDAPEFRAIAQPVEFGTMVALENEVQTVGFPMGGDEVSISNGIVSRVEVSVYCMSGLPMLQVQIDAAVNPGNSGGPVFANNKVVGVAFQGYDKQGLGFMIPIPIIQHFLKETFSGRAYRGFPILPISWEALRNPTLREYYKMRKDQSGLRVSKVDTLCDAYSKLKPDDILLEVDGFKVSNTGKVDIPGIGNQIDIVHLTHMKYIGDSIKLKILRQDAITGNPEILLIDVLMDHVPLETEKVPQTEYDKLPTYYIASGISFIPLSRNYMEGKGCEFEEMYLMEEACSLSDAPKKTPDEQVVVINDILDCKETQGYDFFENSIVKVVNGKPVNNLRDVIAAMESNTGSIHTIMTGSKNVMAVPNMSRVEHEALLKRYHIKQDRSDDLMTDGLSSLPVAMIVKAHAALASEELPAPAVAPVGMKSAQRFFKLVADLEARHGQGVGEEDELDEDFEPEDIGSVDSSRSEDEDESIDAETSSEAEAEEAEEEAPPVSGCKRTLPVAFFSPRQTRSGAQLGQPPKRRRMRNC